MKGNEKSKKGERNKINVPGAEASKGWQTGAINSFNPLLKDPFSPAGGERQER